MSLSTVYAKNLTSDSDNSYLPRIGTLNTAFTTITNQSSWVKIGPYVHLMVWIIVSDLNSPTDTGGDSIIRIELPTGARTGNYVGSAIVASMTFPVKSYINSSVVEINNTLSLGLHITTDSTGGEMAKTTNVPGSSFAVSTYIVYPYEA